MKINIKFKKMFLTIFLFLTVFLGIVINTNAATAPSKITIKPKSSLYYFSESKGTDYISGYNFYRKQLKDGTYGYCVNNINTSVPAGKTLKLKGAITDMGLNYIIQNGYPNKSFTGNDKKDYYITQSAIWEYFDETKGSNNWGKTSFNSSSTGMKKHVYTLVQSAKAARKTDYPTPSVSVTTTGNTMTLNNDRSYFVSNPITVTGENIKDTYTVNLKNAPTGTILKNTEGVVKTTFNVSEKFVVYVPFDSNVTSGSITLTISIEGYTLKTYRYTTGSSSYQDIAPITIYEEITMLTSDAIVLNYSYNVTKVKISKQDITSKADLPGATLVIKDKNGKEMAKWVSSTSPKYVEGLTPGEYTLTETIAPDGYILSTETIKFTVRDDGSVTNVVMYNTLKPEVTKVKISKQDITSKEELPGATLVVKDKNGKEVSKWVSTNTPHYIEGLEAGEYTLTETIAPDGYILSTETIKFTVRNDGSVTSVVMYNTLKPEITKVKISKQDITSKKELPGATLVIKDKDGKEVDKWVSTTTPHYIEGLEAGEYTLTEQIAPDGYILSTETIKFTVKSDGSITSVIMYNAKKVEVPITDLDFSSLSIIIASILITFGTGIVFYNAKLKK